MDSKEKEIFGIETDWIRIRQTRINEIVEATHAGLAETNIDLTAIEQLYAEQAPTRDVFEWLNEWSEQQAITMEKEALHETITSVQADMTNKRAE